LSLRRFISPSYNRLVQIGSTLLDALAQGRNGPCAPPDRIPRVKSRRHLSRRVAKPLAAGIALLGALAVAGCDLQEDADLERGRDLFVQKCGTCHILAEAATTSDVGPNLDEAFKAAREQGMDRDTIEGVVENQIHNPRPANSQQSEVYMPANIVTGEDADAVASYVGKVAGVPGIAPPEAPGGEGGQVFADNGCGSCHTLEAAGSSGTAGPNLDEGLAGQDPKQIEESIIAPDAEIVAGFENIMPDDYESLIPPEDLQLLVEFLATCSGDPDNPDCE
jgi:mono/diheme cytochrome c family protein